MLGARARALWSRWEGATSAALTEEWAAEAAACATKWDVPAELQQEFARQHVVRVQPSPQQLRVATAALRALPGGTPLISRMDLLPSVRCRNSRQAVRQASMCAAVAVTCHTRTLLCVGRCSQVQVVPRLAG